LILKKSDGTRIEYDTEEGSSISNHPNEHPSYHDRQNDRRNDDVIDLQMMQTPINCDFYLPQKYVLTYSHHNQGHSELHSHDPDHSQHTPLPP